MFIDKLILLNRAFLRAIESRIKDTPGADLTLYVLDYLKYLGSLNAMRDGGFETGNKPRPVKVLMHLRKRKANETMNDKEKLTNEAAQVLPERLSSQLNILRSKGSLAVLNESGDVYDEAFSSKSIQNATEASIDCLVEQALDAADEDSRFNVVSDSPKRNGNEFETVSPDGVDLLLSKTVKKTVASTSFVDGGNNDLESLPLTFSFGTTANITNATSFLFGKLAPDKKDDSFPFLDGTTSLVDVSHADILVSASSCSTEVCKNVPVVELDGSAKELSFLISETIPISDLPVDNLGCWNSKAIHMKKRNYYFKDGLLCTTEKDAADSFIERRQYNHAYAIPYRSVIKVIWSAHLLDGTHRRSLITYRIERGASVPMRPYHLSKKSDAAYQRVFPSTLETITSCRQDLTPTQTMSQLLDQTVAAENSVDVRAVSRNKEQIYNRCSSRFPSSKYCGLIKRKEEFDEEEEGMSP